MFVQPGLHQQDTCRPSNYLVSEVDNIIERSDHAHGNGSVYAVLCVSVCDAGALWVTPKRIGLDFVMRENNYYVLAT